MPGVQEPLPAHPHQNMTFPKQTRSARRMRLPKPAFILGGVVLLALILLPAA